ncbi:hypothetical protein RND71_005798 [Anisodus tanguticus]|uniref:Uncharacterized protein n=1 Tax=Anisodus tanguticus TaxID=243964 RepID=A0AAE1SSV9_9SOLA|nr:hypothetical protein RND71_005798 [Anisodus tanguticus]
MSISFVNSELEELKYKYYKDLRDKRVKIRRSGKYFECPYCHDSSKDYDSQELLRHASRIGRHSKSASFRDKARHLGLSKYLDRYIDADKNITDSSKRKWSVPSGKSSRDAKGDSLEPSQITEKSKGRGKFYLSAARTIEAVDRPVDGAEEPPRREKLDAENRVASETPPRVLKMGIVANVPVEYKEDKVHPLWNFRGHTGYAIVDFKEDWSGFMNDMAFELDKHGKRDWNSVRCRDDKLYAWIACHEDYYSNTLISKHLRKHGDLKSVSGIQEENKRKDSSLLRNLTNALEMKNKECEDMKKKISRTEVFMDNVMTQKEEMFQNYNAEMEMMRDKAFNQLCDVIREHEESKMPLEAQKQKLMLQEQELRKREALNERSANDSDICNMAHALKWHLKTTSSVEIIDEDDEKLNELKAEYGEVYQSVVTALNKLNEHNPSGSYPVPQLWNNKEKRTASLNEGVEHILKQWKLHKRKTRGSI